MIDHERVAICFISADKDIAKEQSGRIDKNKLGFEVEEYFRYERNSFLCQTFSQMINETIDDTESEFMIFINPKTIICTKDIEFIIDKLCILFHLTVWTCLLWDDQRACQKNRHARRTISWWRI